MNLYHWAEAKDRIFSRFYFSWFDSVRLHNTKHKSLKYRYVELNSDQIIKVIRISNIIFIMYISLIYI